jgi:hypothetical protein
MAWTSPPSDPSDPYGGRGEPAYPLGGVRLRIGDWLAAAQFMLELLPPDRLAAWWHSEEATQARRQMHRRQALHGREEELQRLKRQVLRRIVGGRGEPP